MSLRCVYTDLDGTLLGRGASVFRDGDGGFSLLPARALEACFRAGVEVVPMSGRRREMLFEDSRLLGLTSFVYEIGAGMVIDGENTLLTGDLRPRGGKTVHDLIAESGAPRLLFDHFRGRLEYHDPWHTDREVTHLLRGLIDTAEADSLLEENGLGHLRVIDNGQISPKPSLAALPGPPHAYHLLPAGVSKAEGVAAHMRARGFAPEDCIAVGDSPEDVCVAPIVGRFFLVANSDAIAPGAEVTEAPNGEGFYEAVVRSIAERRPALR